MSSENENMVMYISLLAVAIFYGVIAIVSLIRLVKVFTMKNSINISKIFYILLLLSAIARGISLWKLAYDMTYTKSNKNDYVYIMLFFPDMMNNLLYVVLMWYFFSYYVNSHISMANDQDVFSRKKPILEKKTSIILYVIISVVFILDVLIIILTSEKVIYCGGFFILISLGNLLTPLTFMSIFIYLYVKYSGCPYKNNIMEGAVNKILIVSVTWSVSRLFIGLSGLIFLRDVIDRFILDITNNPNTADIIAPMILTIVYFFFTEFLPDILALDSSFLATYIVDEDEEDIEKNSLNSKLINPDKINSNSPNGSFIGSSVSQTKVDVSTYIVGSKDINLIDIIYKKKKGFGTIYQASYLIHQVVCRVIKFERLSTYELESLSNDMLAIMGLKNDNLCIPIGVCVDLSPTIYILYPYYNQKSLYNVLHENKTQFSFPEKIRIMMLIAKGLEYLHKKNIYHYHLSSNNILMDDNNDPKITDFGFNSLIDNAGIFLNYKNKNSYSSPEVLENYKTVGSGDSAKADIYSFGILCWEIYTSLIPFDVDIKKTRELVVKEEYRPEITNDFNNDLSKIIRLCWDKKEENRPDIKTVISLLNSISH